MTTFYLTTKQCRGKRLTLGGIAMVEEWTETIETAQRTYPFGTYEFSRVLETTPKRWVRDSTP